MMSAKYFKQRHSRDIIVKQKCLPRINCINLYIHKETLTYIHKQILMKMLSSNIKLVRGDAGLSIYTACTYISPIVCVL